MRVRSLPLTVLAAVLGAWAAPPTLADEAAARLAAAARRGDAAALAALLREGADPNARDEAGRPVLVVAAAAGRPEAVRALLRAGARPDDADRGGTTALHKAVESGDLATVRAVLDGGAVPDVVARAGGTALDVAERDGRASIARQLRARGARGSGKSIGDTVCVRLWGGDGYCGQVAARDATRFELRVSSLLGCATGCGADAACSAGRRVGREGIALGETLWVPGSCLTHTGVR